MASPDPSAAPRDAEARPLVVYDGDCGMCRAAVEWLGARTGERVAFAPAQDDPDPRVDREAARAAVHLVEPDGRTFRGARACIQALAKAPARGWVLALLAIPGFGAVAEWWYRAVAARRSLLSRALRLVSGPGPSTFVAAPRLFVLLLGLLFTVAFASFWVEAAGLLGSGGLLPLEKIYDWHDPDYGVQRWLRMPTLFWLWQGDAALHAVCTLGTAASLLLAFGLVPRIALLVAWACYLSLMLSPDTGLGYIGNPFAMFEWDGLLLEIGFLSLFFVPGGVRARWQPRREPSAGGRLLLRLLLLRVVFTAGLVKWLSADNGWHADVGLAAFGWTQPLPSPIGLELAWADGFSRLLTGAVVVLELVLPWLLFGPRRLRLLAALGIAAVHLGYFASGSRGFFHLLVVALCALQLDDRTLRLLPWRWLGAWLGAPFAGEPLRPARAVVQYARGASALLLAALAVAMTVRAVAGSEPTVLDRALLRYPIANVYSLTTRIAPARPEVVIERSDDGVAWRDVEFRFKPGDPMRAPRWAGAFLPRLDWAMHVVAHAVRQGQAPPAWFNVLLIRILEGGEGTRSLLAEEAVADAARDVPPAPPRMLRVRVYDYRPTELAERERTGRWWLRSDAGITGRPVVLRDGRLAPGD